MQVCMKRKVNSMTISTDDLIKSILESFDRIEFIKSEDIPNIDLYMDQVTTFMDAKMKSTTRYPREDKILTKTMINNYAKNNLLPPPIKKKYSKEHLLILIFIYYFKNILSISDIQELLTPLTEQFFGGMGEIKLTDIYDEVFGLRDAQVESLKQEVQKAYADTQKTFADVEGDEKEFLQQFAFICVLSFDVYIKKLLIEKMVDDMREKRQQSEGANKKTKDKAGREAEK